MKNLISLLIILVLTVSCSGDDNPDPVAKPADQIPANQKFLDRITGESQTITLGYDSEKRVNNIVRNNVRYEISYQDGFLRKIRIHSGDRKGSYTFGHHANGNISTCIVRDFTTDELSGVIGIVYNAATTSYSDWMYLYPDGSIRKTIINGIEKVFVYDTTKKGGLANTNSEVMLYLMFADRYSVDWPQFLSPLPAVEVVYPTGTTAIQNTYDSDGFIIKSHRESPANNLDVNYSYMAL